MDVILTIVTHFCSPIGLISPEIGALCRISGNANKHAKLTLNYFDLGTYFEVTLKSLNPDVMCATEQRYVSGIWSGI